MGVLVLGMHRSGTSALAGALEAMGFAVGPDDDVMPADVGDPEGYFELLSIVRANDDLLARFGGRWDSPPDFEGDWTRSDVANDFVDASRGALDELFEDGHYVLKDPANLDPATALAADHDADGCAGRDRSRPVGGRRVAHAAQRASDAHRTRALGGVQPRDAT